jgi:hypothetical protein
MKLLSLGKKLLGFTPLIVQIMLVLFILALLSVAPALLGV